MANHQHILKELSNIISDGLSSSERAQYTSEGCSPSQASNSGSEGIGELDKLSFSSERAQYISEGCSPSFKAKQVTKP